MSTKRQSFRNTKAFTKRLQKRTFAAVLAVLLVVASPVFVLSMRAHADTDNIFPSTTPNASVNTTDGKGVELGMKFTSDESGLVTGIRFYKGDSTNGGTHYGHLWTFSGDMLAQAQFKNEPGSGWQDASFSNPVSIAANTVYVASYYAPQGHYDYTTGGLAISQGGGPLHTVADAKSQDGIYSYTSNATGAFPTSSYNASNYWVDVDFTPGRGSADTTSPAVSTTSLTSSQTVSGLADNVGNALLHTVAGSTIANGALTYTSNATGAFLSTPRSTTSMANSSHALSAKAASTSSNVDTPATVNVTVRNSNSSGSATSIWPSSATPAHVDGGDANSGNLGVKFSSYTSGYITGIRFYKAGNNDGTHIGELWTASGTLLTQATFTNESTSGWQNVAFSQNVPITAGAIYIASYFDPLGHYSYDHGTDPGSLTNAVDNPPLHTLASGAGGGNGVYNYSSTASFPNQSFGDSNYWIDVLFSPTNTSPDITPPNVSVTDPTNGQTVSGTTMVTANAFDNTTVSSVQFYLDGQAIGNLLTAAPYAFTWNTTAVSNGSHTLTTKAADANGNISTPSSIQITVQNSTPPHTDIRDPGPILILADPTNPFGEDYCATLFKVKGASECTATDTGSLTSSFSLNGYRTIVLVDNAPLTSSQMTIVSSWVDAGGTFLAMSSSDNLDSVLGIGHANNIPIAPTNQSEMLWDGRNSPNASNVSDGTSTLSFTVDAGTKNSQPMTPVSYMGKTLRSITIDGSSATYTTQTINGVNYAFVTVPTGTSNLVASYR